MNNIPTKLRDQLAGDPEYTYCARRSAACRGRITWEHAWIYAGRQIQQRWAILPLCVYHHLGLGLDKDINRWLSLNRASAADLAKYPRVAWDTIRAYLDRRYGAPVQNINY